MSECLEASVKTTRAAIDALSIDQIRELAMKHGYELRKRGQKREKRQALDDDGNPVRNTYAPHIAITATCYARTWKMYRAAVGLWGNPTVSVGEIWEKRLLLGCEHIIRYLSRGIGGDALLSDLKKLVEPLPREEYLTTKKNKEKTK